MADNDFPDHLPQSDIVHLDDDFGGTTPRLEIDESHKLPPQQPAPQTPAEESKTQAPTP